MSAEEKMSTDTAINYIKENCLTKYNVVMPEAINFNLDLLSFSDIDSRLKEVEKLAPVRCF